MKYPLAAALVLMLSGCLGDGSSPLAPSSPNNPTTPNETARPPLLKANASNPDFAGSNREFEAPACSAGGATPRAGGGSYSVSLQSASGHNIAFTVFEPSKFNCEQGNPLVLEGHGYGGSRASTPRGIMPSLIEAGAGVISIDQRGFGDSGGTVRVMDPDFEGQDLLQILDWAEANLDWLRYSNAQPAGQRKFNPVIGATGGSYGGGYQLLIHNVDPLNRLDALTPDITWNDLRYSLNPGGAYGIKDFSAAEGQISPVGVVKSGWALLLVAGGEAGSLSPKLQAGQPQALQTSGQDFLIRETLLRGATANRFPAGALEFFRYHSPSYWCDAEVAREQTFLRESVTPGLAQKKPAPVDILFTQGFRDTLFNFNEAWHNFKCYRGLEDAKGRKADVRLLTHQSGHILPISPGMVPGLADLAEQGAQNGLNEIEFQKPGGPFACGSLGIADAQFAFLVDKLFTAAEAQKIKTDTQSKAFDMLASNKGKVCMSLADDVGQGEASENAAIWLDEDKVLAKLGPQAKGLATASELEPIAVDFVPGDPLNTLTSAVAGILRYPFAPAVVPIDLPAGVTTIAGIPTGTLEIAPPADMLMNPACTPLLAATGMSPIGLLGLEPACDPMVFVGLGVNRNGAWRLVDDQVTPIRGFGKRHVELTGVAERLAEGEQFGLLVYGYHPQYLGTGSRDLASPLVALRGTINLPIVKFMP
ncbi:MAG TPA: CocE/NonD family hydrolase [Limnobacter sp.]|nr:CocE/NonD family hydrolase [Limnobacter sp.]